MSSKQLIFLNHYLGGFNNSNHRVTLLEFQLFRAAPGNRALDEIVPNFHDDVSQLRRPNWISSIFPRSLFLAEIAIPQL
jgi:hypothetical protein